MRTHITTDAYLKSILPENGPQEIDRKPRGFWYGVDGDWLRWCRGANWGLSGRKPNYEYRVDLGDEKILTLSSVAKIDDFHDSFRAKKYSTVGNCIDCIDWRAVAKKYDGIEIAPYQWGRRFDGEASRWYYPWDCASGCIWRPKGAIVSHPTVLALEEPRKIAIRRSV